jgi:hypothetical protein
MMARAVQTASLGLDMYESQVGMSKTSENRLVTSNGVAGRLTAKTRAGARLVRRRQHQGSLQRHVRRPADAVHHHQHRFGRRAGPAHRLRHEPAGFSGPLCLGRAGRGRRLTARGAVSAVNGRWAGLTSRNRQGRDGGGRRAVSALPGGLKMNINSGID